MFSREKEREKAKVPEGEKEKDIKRGKKGEREEGAKV